MTKQVQNGAGAQGSSAAVSEEDLKKSLDQLEGIVDASPSGRKQALLSKAVSGIIGTDENVELMKLLGGETFAKSLSGGVTDVLNPANNDTLSKSVDVSPYLDELHNSLSTAMIQVSDHIEKSDARHQEQVVVLAKGILDIGKAVAGIVMFQKSLGEKLGVIERLPARAPRALGVGANQAAAPTPNELAKSREAQNGQSNTLSKAQVNDLLSEMLEQSSTAGLDGMSKGGHNILIESSQYEQFNDFSNKEFQAEVIAFARAKNQAQRTNGAVR